MQGGIHAVRQAGINSVMQAGRNAVRHEYAQAGRKEYREECMHAEMVFSENPVNGTYNFMQLYM